MKPYIRKVLAFPYDLPSAKAALYLSGYATMMSGATIFFSVVASSLIEWIVPCVFALCAIQAWFRVVAIKRGRNLGHQL